MSSSGGSPPCHSMPLALAQIQTTQRTTCSKGLLRVSPQRTSGCKPHRTKARRISNTACVRTSASAFESSILSRTKLFNQAPTWNHKNRVSSLCDQPNVRFTNLRNKAEPGSRSCKVAAANADQRCSKTGTACCSLKSGAHVAQSHLVSPHLA